MAYYEVGRQYSALGSPPPSVNPPSIYETGKMLHPALGTAHEIGAYSTDALSLSRSSSIAPSLQFNSPKGVPSVDAFVAYQDLMASRSMYTASVDATTTFPTASPLASIAESSTTFTDYDTRPNVAPVPTEQHVSLIPPRPWADPSLLTYSQFNRNSHISPYLLSHATPTKLHTTTPRVPISDPDAQSVAVMSTASSSPSRSRLGFTRSRSPSLSSSIISTSVPTQRWDPLSSPLAHPISRVPVVESMPVPHLLFDTAPTHPLPSHPHTHSLMHTHVQGQSQEQGQEQRYGQVDAEAYAYSYSTSTIAPTDLDTASPALPALPAPTLYPHTLSHAHTHTQRQGLSHGQGPLHAHAPEQGHGYGDTAPTLVHLPRPILSTNDPPASLRELAQHRMAAAATPTIATKPTAAVTAADAEAASDTTDVATTTTATTADAEAGIGGGAGTSASTGARMDVETNITAGVDAGMDVDAKPTRLIPAPTRPPLPLRRPAPARSSAAPVAVSVAHPTTTPRRHVPSSRFPRVASILARALQSPPRASPSIPATTATNAPATTMPAPATVPDVTGTSIAHTTALADGTPEYRAPTPMSSSFALTESGPAHAAHLLLDAPPTQIPVPVPAAVPTHVHAHAQTTPQPQPQASSPATATSTSASTSTSVSAAAPVPLRPQRPASASPPWMPRVTASVTAKATADASTNTPQRSLLPPAGELPPHTPPRTSAVPLLFRFLSPDKALRTSHAPNTTNTTKASTSASTSTTPLTAPPRPHVRLRPPSPPAPNPAPPSPARTAAALALLGPDTRQELRDVDARLAELAQQRRVHERARGELGPYHREQLQALQATVRANRARLNAAEDHVSAALVAGRDAERVARVAADAAIRHKRTLAERAAAVARDACPAAAPVEGEGQIAVARALLQPYARQLQLRLGAAPLARAMGSSHTQTSASGASQTHRSQLGPAQPNSSRLGASQLARTGHTAVQPIHANASAGHTTARPMRVAASTPASTSAGVCAGAAIDAGATVSAAHAAHAAGVTAVDTIASNTTEVEADTAGATHAALPHNAMLATASSGQVSGGDVHAANAVTPSDEAVPFTTATHGIEAPPATTATITADADRDVAPLSTAPATGIDASPRHTATALTHTSPLTLTEKTTPPGQHVNAPSMARDHASTGSAQWRVADRRIEEGGFALTETMPWEAEGEAHVEVDVEMGNTTAYADAAEVYTGTSEGASGYNADIAGPAVYHDGIYDDNVYSNNAYEADGHHLGQSDANEWLLTSAHAPEFVSPSLTTDRILAPLARRRAEIEAAADEEWQHELRSRRHALRAASRQREAAEDRAAAEMARAARELELAAERARTERARTHARLQESLASVGRARGELTREWQELGAAQRADHGGRDDPGSAVWARERARQDEVLAAVAACQRELQAQQRDHDTAKELAHLNAALRALRAQRAADKQPDFHTMLAEQQPHTAIPIAALATTTSTAAVPPVPATTQSSLPPWPPLLVADIHLDAMQLAHAAAQLQQRREQLRAHGHTLSAHEYQARVDTLIVDTAALEAAKRAQGPSPSQTAPPVLVSVPTQVQKDTPVVAQALVAAHEALPSAGVEVTPTYTPPAAVVAAAVTAAAVPQTLPQPQTHVQAQPNQQTQTQVQSAAVAAVASADRPTSAPGATAAPPPAPAHAPNQMSNQVAANLGNNIDAAMPSYVHGHTEYPSSLSSYSAVSAPLLHDASHAHMHTPARPHARHAQTEASPLHSDETLSSDRDGELGRERGMGSDRATASEDAWVRTHLTPAHRTRSAATAPATTLADRAIVRPAGVYGADVHEDVAVARPMARPRGITASVHAGNAHASTIGLTTTDAIAVVAPAAAASGAPTPTHVREQPHTHSEPEAATRVAHGENSDARAHAHADADVEAEEEEEVVAEAVAAEAGGERSYSQLLSQHSEQLRAQFAALDAEDAFPFDEDEDEAEDHDHQQQQKQQQRQTFGAVDEPGSKVISGAEPVLMLAPQPATATAVSAPEPTRVPTRVPRTPRERMPWDDELGLSMSMLSGGDTSIGGYHAPTHAATHTSTQKSEQVPTQGRVPAVITTQTQGYVQDHSLNAGTGATMGTGTARITSSPIAQLSFGLVDDSLAQACGNLDLSDSFAQLLAPKRTQPAQAPTQAQVQRQHQPVRNQELQQTQQQLQQGHVQAQGQLSTNDSLAPPSNAPPSSTSIQPPTPASALASMSPAAPPPPGSTSRGSDDMDSAEYTELHLDLGDEDHEGDIDANGKRGDGLSDGRNNGNREYTDRGEGEDEYEEVEEEVEEEDEEVDEYGLPIGPPRTRTITRTVLRTKVPAHPATAGMGMTSTSQNLNTTSTSSLTGDLSALPPVDTLPLPLPQSHSHSQSHSSLSQSQSRSQDSMSASVMGHSALMEIDDEDPFAALYGTPAPIPAPAAVAPSTGLLGMQGSALQRMGNSSSNSNSCSDSDHGRSGQSGSLAERAAASMLGAIQSHTPARSGASLGLEGSIDQFDDRHDQPIVAPEVGVAQLMSTWQTTYAAQRQREQKEQEARRRARKEKRANQEQGGSNRGIVSREDFSHSSDHSITPSEYTLGASTLTSGDSLLSQSITGSTKGVQSGFAPLFQSRATTSHPAVNINNAPQSSLVITGQFRPTPTFPPPSGGESFSTFDDSQFSPAPVGKRSMPITKTPGYDDSFMF